LFGQGFTKVEKWSKTAICSILKNIVQIANRCLTKGYEKFATLTHEKANITSWEEIIIHLFSPTLLIGELLCQCVKNYAKHEFATICDLHDAWTERFLVWQRAKNFTKELTPVSTRLNFSESGPLLVSTLNS
jgi:hypothetical protein